MFDLRLAALLITLNMLLCGAVAHADPQLVKCPDNSHVWNESQCEEHENAGAPFTFPGSGGSESRRGGLLGVVRRALGGLL